MVAEYDEHGVECFIMADVSINTPESDYKLYIHEADYKCKRPIIYS